MQCAASAWHDLSQTVRTYMYMETLVVSPPTTGPYYIRALVLSVIWDPATPVDSIRTAGSDTTTPLVGIRSQHPLHWWGLNSVHVLALIRELRHLFEPVFMICDPPFETLQLIFEHWMFSVGSETFGKDCFNLWGVSWHELARAKPVFHEPLKEFFNLLLMLCVLLSQLIHDLWWSSDETF